MAAPANANESIFIRPVTLVAPATYYSLGVLVAAINKNIVPKGKELFMVGDATNTDDIFITDPDQGNATYSATAWGWYLPPGGGSPTFHLRDGAGAISLDDYYLFCPTTADQIVHVYFRGR